MKGSLFSNYFLEEGIRTTEDWKRLSDEELQKLYLEIENRYKTFSKRKKPDEADTEDGLICPILEILGFRWSRQKSPTKKGRQDVPDFVLFPDDKSKEEFDKESPESKPWDKAVCILEGKRWKRALDKGDKTDPIDPHIPSNQILRYLSIVEPASNGKVVWGILTNGEVWRLYYHRALSRAEGFIEFELSEFFESPNLFNNREKQLEKFKIFYLLFRKDAFVQTEWRAKSYLEIALEEGKRWEEKVSENLKEKIFYEVFPNIAKGLLEDAKLKGKSIDETLLEEIYENTLVILYRLLFLFYAEDRELLPIKNNGYKYYSLSKIRDEIAEIIDRKEALSERGTFFWGRIKNLFKIINEGDKSLGIPPYNGGLFDSKKYPLLEELCIADKFLVPAIDKLSREFTITPPKRINYNDLSVRQLGSIYEGLLEFKLKIAEKDLGIRKENGKELYCPVESEKESIIKKGEVYLTNDKAERKATGSYYTPEYIVQYIVKNTLEPLIQEKIKVFEEWKETLKNKNKNELKKLIEEYSINFDPKLYDDKGNIIGEKDINAYRNALLSLKDPIEEILRLKILDSAMGSGHFLVGAVDYLADRILEILAEISGKSYFGKEIYYSPILYKLENIRNRIIRKAKTEGYIIDEKKLEDKNLIKRIILKRCIYGVDLNPLAVELAKLSLWLHTFTIGAPLSFLDHHLKCGNSLIGASTEDFEKVFQKFPMFGSQYVGIMNAIELVEKIQELTDIDISEVEESLKLYENLRKELEPYKNLLDLYTADLYLQQEGKSLMTILSGANGNPLDIVEGRAKLKEEELNLINYALTLAKNKKFFHWELEFPEVWYEKGGKKKDGGFDAVIGNPPYGAKYDEVDKRILNNLFTTKTKDSAAFFIEKGLNLSKLYLGMILPKSISFYQEWQDIRNYIFEKSYIVKVADTGIAFEEALFEEIILIIKKGKTEEIKTIIDIFEPLKKPFSTKNIAISGSIDYNLMTKEKIIIFKPFSNKHQKIIVKIIQNSIKINNIAENYFGNLNLTDIKRKLNKSENEILIGPFYLFPKSFSKNFIPFIRRDPDLGRYIVKKWYLLEIPSEFEKIKKIVIPRFFIKPLRGNRLVGYWDEFGSFATHHHMISCTIKKEYRYSYPFVTAIINSKVPSFYLQNVIFSGTTETAREMNKPYFSKIPIPIIDFKNYDKNILDNLISQYNTHSFSILQEEIKIIPSNSAVLHDFLSFLAQKMVELNQNKYLLELFIEGKFQKGSEERIKVIELLEKHPQWKDGTSETYQKEIAEALVNQYKEQIQLTDKLIDQIVYHLYGLDEEDIVIIESFFKN